MVLGFGPVKAGSNHGQMDFAAYFGVDHCAEDDVAFGVGTGPDHLSGFVDLEEAHVFPAFDVEDDRAGAFDRHIQQRAFDRPAGCLARPIFACAPTDRHQGGAAVLHDRLDVGEVQVNQTRDGDQLADPLDALAQDVVCHAEGLFDTGGLACNLQEPVVGDGDQGVDRALQGLDRVFGVAPALGSLEGKGARDHANRQGALLARDLGHDC